MIRHIQPSNNNDTQEAVQSTVKATGHKLSAKKPAKKRVAIFIDGSNFYFKIRGLVKEKMNFIIYDYLGLMRELAGPDKRIISVGYYVGVVRAKNNGTARPTRPHVDNPITSSQLAQTQAKALELRKHQQQLFDQLRRQGIVVITGFLMQHDGRYYEKGVDVRLAVDIVDGAYNRKYDEAIIVSSDTDLLPAIAKAQAKGRHVQYVGFSHQPSVAMISRCTSSRLLTVKDIKQFTQQQRLTIAVRRYDDST